MLRCSSPRERRCLRIAAIVVAALPLIGCTGPGLCVHGKNWPFKIGTDEDVSSVSLSAVPTSIDELRALRRESEVRKTMRRIAPVELTTYVLRDVELVSYQRAPDGDVHMVLADEHGHTIIVEAAPPFCADKRTPFYDGITRVRAVVDAEIPNSMMGWRKRTVSLAGVGYFDSLHGQMGVAPNGIELHPILSICFGRSCTLPPIPRAE